jgi:hypothetical protein
LELFLIAEYNVEIVKISSRSTKNQDLFHGRHRPYV